MANRRISELPLIGGSEIDESDLLTLVHVFEVDPVLRNKRITFSGFKDYLNGYYIQGSGNPFNGSVVINKNLTVSGTTTLTTVTGTTANFTDITGSTLAITTPSGATAAIVCSGVVSGGASGFIIQGPLVILP